MTLKYKYMIHKKLIICERIQNLFEMEFRPAFATVVALVTAAAVKFFSCLGLVEALHCVRPASEIGHHKIVDVVFPVHNAPHS